jgi:hypothetical protein
MHRSESHPSSSRDIPRRRRARAPWGKCKRHSSSSRETGMSHHSRHSSAGPSRCRCIPRGTG